MPGRERGWPLCSTRFGRVAGERHTDRVDSPAARNQVTGPVGAGPAHAARPTAISARTIAVVSGLIVFGLLLVLGSRSQHDPGSLASSATSAREITVTPSFPVPAAEVTALVGQEPQFGSLADAGQRGACLQALGYPPSHPILGARTLTVDGRPAVLLVLPGPAAGQSVAVAVRPDCGISASGLIADTTVTRP